MGYSRTFNPIDWNSAQSSEEGRDLPLVPGTVTRTALAVREEVSSNKHITPISCMSWSSFPFIAPRWWERLGVPAPTRTSTSTSTALQQPPTYRPLSTVCENLVLGSTLIVILEWKERTVCGRPLLSETRDQFFPCQCNFLALDRQERPRKPPAGRTYGTRSNLGSAKSPKSQLYVATFTAGNEVFFRSKKNILCSSLNQFFRDECKPSRSR